MKLATLIRRISLKRKPIAAALTVTKQAKEIRTCKQNQNLFLHTYTARERESDFIGHEIRSDRRHEAWEKAQKIIEKSEKIEEIRSKGEKAEDKRETEARQSTESNTKNHAIGG